MSFTRPIIPFSWIPKPRIEEEYFEWIDILEAVEAASGSFSIVELGAGYGRWSIRGCLAARQRGIGDIRVLSVEAEPQHAIWLRDCFRLDGMNGPSFHIIEAAVSDSAGERHLAVRHPKNMDQLTAKEWHGQFLLAKDCGAVVATDEYYCGHPVETASNGWSAIRVPIVTLNSLLETEDFIDIVDMDIQSEELAVVASSLTILKDKVKRLHIATHRHDIDIGLIDVLSRAGWICRRAYPCNSFSETPYGLVNFQDGVQSWINPNFVSVSRLGVSSASGIGSCISSTHEDG
jgi:FkbM family methyltransferase